MHETTRQRMQGASRRWEKAVNGCLPRPSRRNTACQQLDFDPVKLISKLGPPDSKIKISVALNYSICGNLLWQQ